MTFIEHVAGFVDDAGRPAPYLDDGDVRLEYLDIAAKRLQQLSLFSTTGADAPSL